MLTIEEKDYDLKYLLQFDMLREILIKLAKNQRSLQNDIDSIKNSNIERDSKIMSLQEYIKGETGDSEDNNPINNDIQTEEDKKYEEKEKKEIDSENKKEIINNEDMKDDKIEIVEQKNINEGKDEKEINENINKDIKKEEKQKNIQENNVKIEKKVVQKKANYANYLTSDKNNKQLMSNMRECNNKIDQLEAQINNLIQKDFSNLKKELKNHDLENQSDFKLIDTKLSEIQEKLAEYDQKIEDCAVKCASIDILNVIKDSGDGTVDAAKILFKSLEDKCFKKFEIIDARYKQDSIDLMKMKKNVESFVPKLDKVNRNMEQMKEVGEQQKEEIFNNKKESNEQGNKIIKLCEEKNDDILKKLIQLKEEIDKDISKNMKEIEEKLKIIGSKKDDGASSLFKLGLVGNHEVDEEKLQVLDKKINDNRKKTNDLENSFKIFLNEELEVIKNDVKELKFKIDKKISKEDLKELYNLHLSDVDEINDLKDRIGLISDDSKKMFKDVQNIGSKIESLSGNMLLLQNSQTVGGRGSFIDFSKYIDQQKLTDALKPILKEIEKIYKELDSLGREMNEIQNNEKLLEKKERVNQLEEEVYNKITELKLFCNRKYADKIETNKVLKSLEVQIKDLSGKKTDGDGWLMAKQPLKCFNCASCEANIKNAATTQEYIPWNKYPAGERIYRMGQGFSHMLQMMTSEFAKTFDHNDNNNTFNINSENEGKGGINLNATNSLLYQSDKSFSGMKINNKEQVKEDILSFYRTGGKIRLPKMRKFMKKSYGKEKFDESVPVSDEEKDYVGDSVDKINQTTESPKIMKIMKVKQQQQNSFNIGGFNTKTASIMDFKNRKREKNHSVSSSVKARMMKTEN